jgi:ACT domain-containing protein
MEKKVVNIAKYYHHKTVYVGGKEDNIYNNVRKGLDIIRATNYKLKDLIMPLRPAGVKISVR